MRMAHVWAVPALILTSCLGGALYASEPQFTEQREKQEGIYRSQGTGVPSGYTTDRSLEVYGDALCTGFHRALISLGPQDRWLDIGAGEGQAILDYFSSQEGSNTSTTAPTKRKAKAIAMSIEDRRTPRWQRTAAALDTDQAQYFANKRLREYTLNDLGQFQIITDVIGGFSYAEDLSLFVEKTLEFLQPNGTFYTLLQDVHTESTNNRPYYADSPYLTELTDGIGREVKVCSWLKSISCVQVTCEAKSGWNPPIEAYRIRKVCDDVKVPQLSLIQFEAGTPPGRRYTLEKADTRNVTSR